MTEPTATPAALDPSAMTPAQATAEIAQTWENPDHDCFHAGRPGYAAATARMNALDQRRAGAEPTAEVISPPPDDPAPRPNVFDDPHADPTAAILDAVPLPEGLDPVKNQAINHAAEREGLTRFVLEGRRVIAEALSSPPEDPVEAERVLRGRWGSAYPSELESAQEALDAVLAELPPADRAEWERREVDIRSAVLEFMARMGEARMDATTPGGERRLRAKYADRTGG